MVVITDAVNLLQLWSQTAQSWSCSPGCVRLSNPGKSQALSDLIYKWEEPVPASHGWELLPSLVLITVHGLWYHSNCYSGALTIMLVLDVTRYHLANVLHFGKYALLELGNLFGRVPLDSLPLILGVSILIALWVVVFDITLVQAFLPQAYYKDQHIQWLGSSVQ